MSWMWGRPGCDICHPTDRQGWFGGSGWPGGCPLPPSPLRVRPSRSCALSRRGRPSPIEGDWSSVKRTRVAEPTSSALEGGFVSPGSPGKSPNHWIFKLNPDLSNRWYSSDFFDEEMECQQGEADISVCAEDTEMNKARSFPPVNPCFME